jgi:hypothetical protein
MFGTEWVACINFNDAINLHRSHTILAAIILIDIKTNSVRTEELVEFLQNKKYCFLTPVKVFPFVSVHKIRDF